MPSKHSWSVFESLAKNLSMALLNLIMFLLSAAQSFAVLKSWNVLEASSTTFLHNLGGGLVFGQLFTE
jgi:hypothetical protein